MFKNLKLSLKISGGYALILVLLAILAIIAITGFSNIVVKTGLADEFGLLVSRINEIRQNEQQFLLSENTIHVKSVYQKLDMLKQETSDIQSKYSSFDVEMQVDQIIGKADEYKTAFKNYVDLSEKRASIMVQMNEKADLALSTTTGIRNEQNTLFEKLKT